VALSLTEFLRRLDESGVMTAADARAFLTALKIDASTIDGEQLAKRLVKQKKLSAYQAQAVYSGKGKSLTMGSYFVLDKLGQGGMGMVLKAEHRMMKRLVAIKVLSPAVTGTKELQQRFRREVEAAARLTHPNIVAAYDAGEVDGAPFLVMEYVPGDDLQAIVKREGPLSVDQAIHCIVQAAKGLQFAHTHGVIHRDIKPANLLLDTSGTVKILDMGLARIEANDVRTQSELTGTGAVMGTVDYMAPEQAVSPKHADLRSDLYSLGISLWYLLTARSAYEGDSMMARLLAHRDQPIPSLRTVRDDVSESLDAVFRKSVAKNANDRYQSASEFIADMEACRTGASVKAMTVAEVSTGNDEFHDFLKNLENPTQAAAGMKPDSSYTPTLITSEPSLTTTREIRPNISSGRTSQPDRRKRASPNPTKPPQKPPFSRMLLAGGGGSLLLLLAVVFFLKTPYGTLRVEILDPEVELSIKGTELTLRSADIEPVSLQAGEKKLIITRGDLSFETETFVLKKGTETRVKVELIGDQLVVNGDGRVLAEKTVPQGRVTSSTTGSNANSSTSPASANVASQMAKPLWPKSINDLPAGFVPLFNGKDLTGWRGEVGDPRKRSQMTPAELASAQANADERMRVHWRVENGVLTFDGKGDNLCTTQDYADFELYLEWNITAGGDSGVYLRGSPQVQIWDSAVKQNGNGVGSGGLYNNKKHSARPRLNADKPIGEWNAMLIRMVGEKVTVSLNGQLVVDNVVYENYVEPEKPIYPSGPIELQKFGSPLRFRNLMIRELKTSAPLQPSFALQFDGTSFVETKDISWGDLSEFTIEAWVRTEDDLVNEGFLVDRYKSATLARYKGRWQFAVKYAGEEMPGQVSEPVARANGDWEHLAGVVSEGVAHLYVNGKRIGTTTLTKPRDLSQGQKLSLGRKLQAGVRAVRYSKTARYLNEFVPSERFRNDDDTLLLYNFDEGTGDVLNDSSDNKHHGRISGAKWVRVDGVE
jgi:serine/threonine protein kinase